MLKKNNILIIICSIFLSVTIVLINTNILINSETFFNNELEKYGVYSTLEGYNVDAVNKEVFDFLKGDEGLDSGFFNSREIAHLEDVKDVFELLELVLFISIIVVILCLILLIYFNKNIKKIINYFRLSGIFGGMIVIGFSLLLFILLKLNFDFGFEAFHNIFFESGSYLFDPSTEKIVLLYPEGLFLDSAIRIVSGSVITSLVLIFIISIKNLYKFISRLISF